MQTDKRLPAYARAIIDGEPTPQVVNELTDMELRRLRDELAVWAEVVAYRMDGAVLPRSSRESGRGGSARGSGMSPAQMTFLDIERLMDAGALPPVVRRLIWSAHMRSTVTAEDVIREVYADAVPVVALARVFVRMRHQWERSVARRRAVDGLRLAAQSVGVGHQSGGEHRRG